MNSILIPIQEFNGIDSKIADTLGSINYIMIDENGNYEHIVNKNRDSNIAPIKFVLDLKPKTIFAPEACETAIKLIKSQGIELFMVDTNDKIEVLLERYNKGDL